MYLSKQEVDDEIPWEVIIVNNRSTDDTSHKVQMIWKSFLLKVELLVVDEQTPGLTYARHCGVRSSKYDLLIFCDDDNWLESHYVQKVYDFFKMNSHRYSALGGSSTPIVNNICSLPDWFNRLENSYAVGEQAISSGDVTQRGYLWGAGLAVKRNVVIRIFDRGYFFLADRVGNILTSGGDSELCLRMIIGGHSLYYDKDLRFQHFIPCERLSEDYRDRLFKGFEDSSLVLEKYYFFLNQFVWSKIKYRNLIKSHIKYWLSALRVFDLNELSWKLISIYTNYSNQRVDFKLRKIMELCFEELFNEARGSGKIKFISFFYFNEIKALMVIIKLNSIFRKREPNN